MKWRAACLAALLCAASLTGCAPREASATTYAMDTIVSQRVWGPQAQQACSEASRALADFEAQFSLYAAGSDIEKINDAAGQKPVAVQAETLSLLRRAQALSLRYPRQFALTIAPVTLAWNVNGEEPRVPDEAERAALCALVDDTDLVLNEADGTAFLRRAGQGLDLGGVAKGAACDAVRAIYEEYGVQGAVLDIGGNLLVYGEKADGAPFRAGFRDPLGERGTALFSFEMASGQVVAVSGGYERYFEADGTRYIHIFDPTTGAPAESDLAAVGAVCESGLEADFYSTTLYVGGLDEALRYMRAGGVAVAVTQDGQVYLSETLQDGFRWESAQEGEYALHWVSEEVDRGE